MEIPLLRVTGPTPAVVSKLNDVYRRVIYLKHEDTKELYLVKEMIENAKSNSANVDEPVEIEKSTNVSTSRSSKKKQ